MACAISGVGKQQYFIRLPASRAILRLAHIPDMSAPVSTLHVTQQNDNNALHHMFLHVRWWQTADTAYAPLQLNVNLSMQQLL